MADLTNFPVEFFMRCLRKIPLHIFYTMMQKQKAKSRGGGGGGIRPEEGSLCQLVLVSGSFLDNTSLLRWPPRCAVSENCDCGHASGLKRLHLQPVVCFSHGGLQELMLMIRSILLASAPINRSCR